MKKLELLIACVALLLSAAPVFASTPIPFFNGFEADINGWETPNRVVSGTHGVTSATGSYHAEATDDYTLWGGYTDTFPVGGYTTSIDIYLNVDSGITNDKRFDWTSAVSNTSGGHLRDFVFNVGYYNDSDTTGTGPRFIISASNNATRSGAYPKNPGREPYAITSSGWYTFRHQFNNNSGILSVDLSVVNSSGIVLHTWTLSDSTDVIGTTVGGNRYGWFAQNEFAFLAIDNSQLNVTVGPPTEKDQCKDGGWKNFNNPSFKNQGLCVSYVESNNHTDNKKP